MNNIYLAGEVGTDITLSSVISKVNSFKNEDPIKVLISSLGGYADDGDEIKDYLISLPRQIITQNIGDVASAGATIYLAGNRRLWDKTKGRFLIHNPSVEIEGESSDLKLAADELRKLENDIAKYYSGRTGIDKDSILAVMRKNDWLKSEDLVGLGIAHEIIETNNNNVTLKFRDKMTEKQIDEKIDGLFGKIMNKVSEMFKPKNMVTVADAAGAELVFEGVEEGNDPAVGDTATVDGNAAEGEYSLPDGTVYVFEAGAITEIREPEGEGGDGDEMEQLKAENAQLKEQLETLQAQSAVATTKVEEVENRIQLLKTETENTIKDLKSKIKSEFVPKEATPGTPIDEPTKRNFFKTKE